MELTEVVDSRVFQLRGKLHDIKAVCIIPSSNRAIEQSSSRAAHQLAVLRRIEEVSGNVAASCRFRPTTAASPGRPSTGAAVG